MGKQEDAVWQIERAREISDECLLMCSLGKDSLVMLDMVYPRFRRVVCVFMYFVRGLEHIERWVRWVKARYPRVEFVQIPHWCLTYVLRSGLYCVAQPKIRLMNLRSVVDSLKAKYGIGLCFVGFKKADSLNRRLMLNDILSKRGAAGKSPVYEQNGLCFPLADMTQKEVLAYMRLHGLPEPVRYGKDASGGIGFNIPCFLWMEEHFPQDLEKFYEVFPLSRRILTEYHIQEQKEQQLKEQEEQENAEKKQKCERPC